MTMQYMENFSSYGSNASNMLAGLPWAQIYTSLGGGLVDDPDGVSSGKVLKCTTSALGTSASRIAVPTAGTAIGIGFRWFITPLAASESNSPSILFRTGGRSDLYTLVASPTGSLELWRTSPGTDVLLEESDALVITNASWTDVEFWIDTVTGVYEVRVEGQTVLDGTDGSPNSGTVGMIEFWDGFGKDGGAPGSNESDVYIKDLRLMDANGSYNNTFVGPVQILTLRVDGDVSNGWDLSTGTSLFALLNEATPDDADYASAQDDPLPAAAIMTLEDLPEDIVSVKAVQTMVRAFKSDGGDANLVVSLVSGGSEDAGATHAPGTSASIEWDISETDPASGVAWTPTGLDAAYIKLDRTL